MSVAAHEVLQLVGLITGFTRIGGTGPQAYDVYHGVMRVRDDPGCREGCDVAALPPRRRISLRVLRPHHLVRTEISS